MNTSIVFQLSFDEPDSHAAAYEERAETHTDNTEILLEALQACTPAGLLENSLVTALALARTNTRLYQMIAYFHHQTNYGIGHSEDESQEYLLRGGSDAMEFVDMAWPNYHAFLKLHGAASATDLAVAVAQVSLVGCLMDEYRPELAELEPTETGRIKVKDLPADGRLNCGLAVSSRRLAGPLREIQQAHKEICLSAGVSPAGFLADDLSGLVWAGLAGIAKSFQISYDEWLAFGQKCVAAFLLAAPPVASVIAQLNTMKISDWPCKDTLGERCVSLDNVLGSDAGLNQRIQDEWVEALYIRENQIILPETMTELDMVILGGSRYGDPGILAALSRKLDSGVQLGKAPRDWPAKGIYESLLFIDTFEQVNLA